MGSCTCVELTGCEVYEKEKVKHDYEAFGVVDFGIHPADPSNSLSFLFCWKDWLSVCMRGRVRHSV
jgi:hypothetical protein